MGKARTPEDNDTTPLTAEEKHEAFKASSQKAPGFTIVSDRELPAELAHQETFLLDYRLGPVFDILRHSETRTPLAIAIYGRWGVGKSSAMRWLQGKLDEWNTAPAKDRGDHRVVRHVWFDPWKYHDPDDVRRGIIAQVVLATLKEADARLVTGAARRFGALGRAFLDALRAVEVTVGAGAEAGADALGVKAKASAKAEAKANVGAVIDGLLKTEEHLHPERVYLNEFEEALKEWVQELLDERKERLVIFIDDLDRCMPDIALRVLEAIKLYLNIPNLIFVVGVDHIVINQLVMEYYKKQGVNARESAKYLAKMFQVEVPLGPSDAEIERYFASVLGELTELKVELWTAMGEREQEVLGEGMLALARGNPREVKRVVNSALIAGAGATMVDNEITFAQGLQVSLIARRLREEYGDLQDLQQSKDGRDFLMAWAGAVKVSGQTTPGLSEGEIKRFGSEGGAPPSVDAMELEYAGEEVYEEPPLPEVPAGYQPILGEARFSLFLTLLRDEILGGLLRLPYSEEAASAVPAAAPGEAPPDDPPTSGDPVPGGGAVPSKRLEEDRKILRRAVASALGKEEGEVTPDLYTGVMGLTLPAGKFASTELLRPFTSLRSLDLIATEVSDLTPLGTLAGLQTLRLDGTPVSDLTPLGTLAGLETLWLNTTQVSDLTPLGTLAGLESLSLNGTQVSDLTPLGTLTGLESLSLSGTQVSDLTPLGTLTGLQELSLDNTPVSDLTPLGTLAGLRTLLLNNTPVSDLTPLGTLAGLQTLWLNRTQVSDLTPLGTLTGLQMLSLDGTQVSELSIEKFRRDHPDCVVFT